MNLDVDSFMKEMESIMMRQGSQDAASEDDFEEGSSSDLDFGKFCSIIYLSDWTAYFHEFLYIHSFVRCFGLVSFVSLWLPKYRTVMVTKKVVYLHATISLSHTFW